MSVIEIVANDPKGAYLEDVTFRMNGKKFVLGVPEAILQDCERLGIDTTFFTTNVEPSYYGFEDTAELESKTGIRGLAEMIKISTLAVSAKFIDTIKRATEQGGDLPHNGTKFGVSTVTKGRSADSMERMTLGIGIHETSYLTFAIMSNVYQNMKANNHEAFADSQLRHMPQPGKNFGIFFNSLGLNTSVLVKGDRPTTNTYVFGVRKNGELHVAMNEGLRPTTETAGGTFTLDELYERGMEEELGIKAKTVHAAKPVIREMFLVKAKGEFGIHMLTELNMTLMELEAHHARAKDRDENGLFIPVAFNQLGLNRAMAENPKVVPYTRELIAGLVRGMN